MNWKVPIPTEVNDYDTVTRLIICEILLKTRNTDMVAPEIIWHGNKQHLIYLKKGQCVFAKQRFSKEMCTPRRRIERTINLIESGKCTINCTFKREPFGLICTVLNYDQICSMEIKRTINGQSMNNQRTINELTSNKNDKSVKSVKSVENDKDLVALSSNKILIDQFFESEDMELIVRSQMVPYDNQIWFAEQAKITIAGIKADMLLYYTVNLKGSKVEIKSVKPRFIKFLKDYKRISFYQYTNKQVIKNDLDVDSNDLLKEILKN